MLYTKFLYLKSSIKAYTFKQNYINKYMYMCNMRSLWCKRGILKLDYNYAYQIINRKNSITGSSMKRSVDVPQDVLPLTNYFYNAHKTLVFYHLN